MKLLNIHCQLQFFYLDDDGIFPNNTFPAILYKQAINIPRVFPANRVIQLFKKNQWYNAWKDSVFNFNHYHSKTHEVLAAYKGSTQLQLGGDKGSIIKFEKGDVLFVPAGVAHRNLQPDAFFGCVGAYPNGREPDYMYGVAGERPEADTNIKLVPMPLHDPVFGASGGLHSVK